MRGELAQFALSLFFLQGSRAVASVLFVEMTDGSG